MKKILFTLLLVLGISAAADAQVRFLDSSTDAVRKEAIAQDKLVFIDLYATWCGPCKAMERDVFSKKEVGDFMDEYFVAAKYDIDKPTGKALAGKQYLPRYKAGKPPPRSYRSLLWNVSHFPFFLRQ